MCILLLLGFDCLLRTGELLELTGLDFSMGPSSAIVRIRLGKSGQRHGAQEMVSPTDPSILEFLRIFLAERRLQGALASPIWTQSPSCFRKRFNELMGIFGMSQLCFRPYSLRRGGATAFFTRCQSMEATLLRGRWSSSKVAKIYISDALAHLPSIKMSKKSHVMMSKYNFKTLR